MKKSIIAAICLSPFLWGCQGQNGKATLWHPDHGTLDTRKVAKECIDIEIGKRNEEKYHSHLCNPNFYRNNPYATKPDMWKAVTGYVKFLKGGENINRISLDQSTGKKPLEQKSSRSSSDQASGKAQPGSPGANRNFSDAPRQSSGRLAAIPPTPDGPFPFQRNCKAMQSYFNTSVNWSESVTFEGFEKYESTQVQNYLATFNKPDEYYPNAIQCFGGYWTKVTPVRKTVCRGSIVFFANKNQAKYWAGNVGFPTSDEQINSTDCSFDPPYYP